MTSITIDSNEYLSNLSKIIQTEGIRDTFVTERRLKELNKQNTSDLVICHSENKRGKCTVYYGYLSNPSFVDTYEFKLGKVKAELKIKNVLRLDQWEDEFNQTIRKRKIRLNEVKESIVSWSKKYQRNNNREVEQFLSTLKVHQHFTGQLIVAYKEFNGEWQRIKPIIRFYEPVSINELIQFGKEKSRELWNREFTCKVKLVKKYWKGQLGVYYPDKKEIVFSEYQNAILPKEMILDTMLHEMVHWHLHTIGKKYDDDDFEFIEECIRVGCGL